MKQYLNLWMLLMIAALFTACEDDDNVDFFDSSASSGNLVISNHSDHALALYHNGKLFKKIPNTSTDFIVWLPNDSDQTFDLQMYKYEDAKANNFASNPDINTVFKRWSINLSNSQDVEKRATWHITNDPTEINSGSLKFSYVGGTNHQVDVFLNGQNGAKIVTLKPGDQYDNIVGIDYGAYTLHYRYWISDPNTPEGITITGWVETEVVAGMEEDIWVVINDSRPELHKFIPHYENSDENTDTRGRFKIYNHTSAPIFIRANGYDIEDIMYLDGSTQAASIIAAGDNAEYIVEADDYLLSATRLDSNNPLAEDSFVLSVGELAKWTLKIVDGEVVTEKVDEDLSEQETN